MNMRLFATITVCLAAFSSAFAPPLACVKLNSNNVSLLLSSSDNDTPDVSCGTGFKKIEGADGPCCAYDFDTVSSKLTPSVFDDNPDLVSKFEEKNKARKNFALPPLSPEEFVVLQAQIHAMERDQGDMQSIAKQAIVEGREERQKQEQLKSEASSGLLQSFMDGIFQDTCQSNFDCERPEVCCDFRFRKVCCSSGNTNRDIENELAAIPVPQRG